MKSKKRKILLGIGIFIVALATSGWLFFRLHLSWVAMEDILPSVIHQEEEATVIVSLGFDIVFSTEEPVAYVGNERLVMRDGVRIRNGRPYLNMRDAGVLNDDLNEILEAMWEENPDDIAAVMVNGLYNQGTDEQNEMIHSFLGGEDARERFELYFQWYNTIHELGHLITVHNGTYDGNDFENMRHMIEEELLVNSFAVAFWMYHGEEGKIEALEEMVDYVLSHITPPVDDMSHLDFMRAAVDEDRMAEVFTFEKYGWFQFSMVRDILRERDSLDLSALLTEMIGEEIQVQPQQTLVYPTLGIDVAPEIVADAVSILREWGVDIPDVYMAFDTDPNVHMLQGPLPRAVLVPSIEAGRLVPASR